MKNKSKIILSAFGFVLSLALLIASAILAENEIISPASAVAFVIISVILVFVATFYIAKIDYETGVYECRKCGHIFKPTYSAYIWGPHTLTTRHLKCPKCEERSWCKVKREK